MVCRNETAPSAILRLVKRTLAPLLFLALLSCRETETKIEDPQAHRGEIEKWQKNRATRLQAEDGWLSLVGLFWLNEGANKLPEMGVFTLQNGKVLLKPDAGAGLEVGGKPITSTVELKSDADPSGPTVVTAGSKRFQIIKRSDRYGVRVKDAQSEARRN